MLIECKECGGKISSKAITCPHCGYPLGDDRYEKKIDRLQEEIKNIRRISQNSSSSKFLPILNIDGEKIYININQVLRIKYKHSSWEPDDSYDVVITTVDGSIYDYHGATLGGSPYPGFEDVDEMIWEIRKLLPIDK